MKDAFKFFLAKWALKIALGLSLLKLALNYMPKFIVGDTAWLWPVLIIAWAVTFGLFFLYFKKKKDHDHANQHDHSTNNPQEGDAHNRPSFKERVSSIPWGFILLVILIVLMIGIIFFFVSREKNSSSDPEQQEQTSHNNGNGDDVNVTTDENNSGNTVDPTVSGYADTTYNFSDYSGEITVYVNREYILRPKGGNVKVTASDGTSWICIPGEEGQHPTPPITLTFEKKNDDATGIEVIWK